MAYYKFLLTVTFTLIGLALFCAPANAEKVFVVVHKDNTDKIDQETIKNIYSDNKFYWDSGSPIIVYELPVTSRVRNDFSNAILNQSALSSQREWSNRFVNNTLNNEIKVKPERLVVRFVGAKKNAIGYVTESVYKSSTNLKIVLVIE